VTSPNKAGTETTPDLLQTIYTYYGGANDRRSGQLNTIERWVNRHHTLSGWQGLRGVQSYDYYANGRAFKTKDANFNSEYFGYNLFTSDMLYDGSASNTLYTRSGYHTDYNGNTTETI